jgi:hypothetical protein
VDNMEGISDIKSDCFIRLEHLEFHKIPHWVFLLTCCQHRLYDNRPDFHQYPFERISGHDNESHQIVIVDSVMRLLAISQEFLVQIGSVY